MSSQDLDATWEQRPEYIRRFYESLESNKSLCKEVEYILSAKIVKEDIEVAHITSRAKTLESFCEKINRKLYDNPFDDVTDLAGVRIVFLYAADRPKIESVIEREFQVVERFDKNISDDDKFGYGALHYLVKMKNKHAGARYDDLKNKICEIQVRTILQDAWAVVAHHLSYKQESDVPKTIRRKLNALSGLFETADDQFENIRIARHLYQAELKDSIQGGKKLSKTEEVNIDDLQAYLESRFPEREHRGADGMSKLLYELKKHGFSTLSDIDKMLDASIDAVLAKEKKYPPTQGSENVRYTTVGMVRVALSFMSDEYLNERSKVSKDMVYEFKRLIKKP